MTVSTLATNIGVTGGILTNVGILNGVVATRTANLIVVDTTLGLLSSGLAREASAALGVGSAAMALSTSHAAATALLFLGSFSGGSNYRSEIDDCFNHLVLVHAT